MRNHPLLLVALLALACAVVCVAAEPVRVVDHELRSKAYPVYMGKALGWQDLYNQDDAGAYYLERVFEFCHTRIGLRVTQAFIGDATWPTGRLAVRYPKSAMLVTGTQPIWVSTWCRYDAQYLGMLDVFIGEHGLDGVAPKLECGNAGAAGFVRARWRHDAGQVVATLLMLPDDDRVFVEVGASPTAAAAPVAVSLCCWPLGKFRARTASGWSDELTYGKVHTLPPGEPTVLFTDPKFDPKGKVQNGACALTYLPAECESVTAKRTFPCYVTLKLRPGVRWAHVVLWELLHRRGDGAFAYVAAREAETLARWDSMGGVLDPQLAARRDAGMARARAALLDLGAVEAPQLDANDGPLDERALRLRWAAFYRAEAERQLDSANWRAALEAIERASAVLGK